MTRYTVWQGVGQVWVQTANKHLRPGRAAQVAHALATSSSTPHLMIADGKDPNSSEFNPTHYVKVAYIQRTLFDAMSEAIPMPPIIASTGD